MCPCVAVRKLKDNYMAKGNKRGNRESKKPKQVKAAPVAAPMFEKGALVPAAAPKKKKG